MCHLPSWSKIYDMYIWFLDRPSSSLNFSFCIWLGFNKRQCKRQVCSIVFLSIWTVSTGPSLKFGTVWFLTIHILKAFFIFHIAVVSNFRKPPVESVYTWVSYCANDVFQGRMEQLSAALSLLWDWVTLTVSIFRTESVDRSRSGQMAFWNLVNT